MNKPKTNHFALFKNFLAIFHSVYRVLFSLLVVKASGTFYPLSTLPTEHIHKLPEYKNNVTGTNVLTLNSTNA